MCWHASREFSCGMSAPSLARQFCTQQLHAVFGSPGPPAQSAEPVIETTALVASELVTNAVKAGCRSADLSLSVHRNYLELTVGDDAAGYPELLDAAPTNDHGWGLFIVAALSGSWGVDRTETGKQVWAKVPIPNQILS